MAVLGVNVDHVATLRQARLVDYPCPVEAAKIAVAEAVSCVTIHLREDRRHIQDADVQQIRNIDGCRLNLEMAANEEIINIALTVKPDQVTIVPERRQELTTEGGLNVAGDMARYRLLTERFHDAGIPVSFFIDAERQQIEACSSTLAEAIEINSGKYSEAKSESDMARCLRQLKDGVDVAKSLGLTVHAGHGLHYKNVSPIAAIPGLEELNIGHSIIAKAVFVGLPRAISEMKMIIDIMAKKGAE